MSSSLEKISQSYAGAAPISNSNNSNFLMESTGLTAQMMNSNHLIAGLNNSSINGHHHSNIIGMMNGASTSASNNNSMLGGRKHSDLIYSSSSHA